MSPQTLVFEFYGVLGLLVQTVVLRVMLRAVGEVYVLLTGLVFETMRLVLLGFAQAKYQARASSSRQPRCRSPACVLKLTITRVWTHEVFNIMHIRVSAMVMAAS